MPRSLFRSSPRTATRIATLAVLALFVVTTASGCAERKETVGGEVSKSYLSLLLDWTPNPDHAGIYTGLAKKRFEAQGLSLKISNPSDAASVIQQVAAGRYDIGISYQPEVMSARDSGVKIKAVASIVPTPLNSLMWLKSSKVKNIKDLEGKRVGTSGAYQSAYLDAMLEDNGVDPATVKDTNVGFDLNPALVAGKVDATVGGYWNVEAIQLKQAGKPVTATPVDKLGAPPYDELVIIASEDTLNDQIKSDRIRQFLAGLKKGTADAKANPALAVAALLKADKTQDPTFVKASVAATLPALTANAVFGYLDPKKWDTYAKWMRDNNLLKNPPTTTDAFTNDLLPSTVPK